ncbi:hypothetical protein BJI49_11710 [Acetobacter pasteurianus]|uniref:hypothetical protein n=1 Tax=Acetobacter pasteurianus TaxID=438 RepID=UPI0002457BCF|nr:hypothetical protein [Acetobacter pasteurianus]RCL05003.1 hypothetical protein BJI49_11710 [Acetobacter pasteurianus]GAB30083.1 phage integrase [Acetobacter pasteurianus subsp. pasteurianus LMG 1262 = NBRC 106471]
MALALFLYTGQRRSDVIRVGPARVKNGSIEVVQIKTGKYLLIPAITRSQKWSVTPEKPIKNCWLNLHGKSWEA